MDSFQKRAAARGLKLVLLASGILLLTLLAFILLESESLRLIVVIIGNSAAVTCAWFGFKAFREAEIPVVEGDDEEG
jgi:hypothetical protein